MSLDCDYLKKNFIDRPFRKGTMSIVDYAETTSLPSGKFRGVRFSHKRSPYLKEPLSLLSPESSYQQVTCMFPAQTGKSTIAEMLIEYYIVEYPAEILYVSSNETAAMKFMQRRIEPRCALKGVEFRADVDSKSARRTGDTAYSKSFNGGNLDIASSLSPSQLASESKRLVIADEIDRWKLTLGNEGNPLDILYARTQAWGDEKKILLISTPTSEDISVINQLFLEGDQRFYYVPCPYCGEMQTLDFMVTTGYGLTWDLKSGSIDKKTISLICKSCHREIKENKKNEMLNGGEWRPTVISSNEYSASFHINGLYSPFLSWYDMAFSFQETIDGDPQKKQTFENLKMGRPHKPTGRKPKPEKVIENRGNYKSGTVPDGVLYLTVGIDVQEGSANSETNPPRIEMEVLGIGYAYKTWSIEYKVFKGSIEDPDAGAWQELFEYMESRNFMYYRKEDNFGFPVSMIFIDSGDGNMTYIVYAFCQRWMNTFPIKGRRNILKKKNEKINNIDEEHQGNIRKYRFSKLDDDVNLVLINTNYYKTQIYHNINIPREQSGPQRNRFCEFPADYGERYFEMLLSEEQLRDGSFDSRGRRNEALDCFDKETQILTDEGWKYFYDLNKNEKVATVNLEKDEIEFQKPFEYIQRKHSGDMIKIKGQRLDILVTPKHRMIASMKKQEVISHKPYKRKWNLNTPFEFVTAENLTIHHQLKNSSTWNQEIKDIEIEEYISKQNILISEKKYINPYDWAAFLGIYLAEGHKKENYNKKTRCNNYRIIVDQKKPENIIKIRELLNRLPFKFNEYLDKKNYSRFTCTEKQLFLALEECGDGAQNKKTPEWIKNQDMSVISAFLGWAIMGDGHVDKHGHRSYYTISKKLADDIQELFIKSGSNARIDYIIPKPYKNFRNDINYNGGENVKPQYHVRESRFSKKSLDGVVNGKRTCLAEKIKFDDEVYCVSVPNETLILRRGGISFIAGNCRVYGLCAGDVYLESEVENWKLYFKSNGYSPQQLLEINSRWVIDRMVKDTAVKIKNVK